MTDPTGILVAISIGLPQRLEERDPSDGRDRSWSSGIFKSPQTGPITVHEMGVAGDGQADTRAHGGLDKAVLAYSADHYSHWRDELEIADLTWGGFGENLSIAGIDESSVAIGDVWQVGDVRLQVSQPRQPCWKLARRWQRPDLTRQVLQNGRSGWYCRVRKAGVIEAGQQVTLLHRPHPEWTITRCQDAMYRQTESRTTLFELVNLPELAEAWKRELA